MAVNPVNTSYNKSVYALVVGALVQVAAGVWPELFSADVWASIQTALVAILVLVIPNADHTGNVPAGTK